MKNFFNYTSPAFFQAFFSIFVFIPISTYYLEPKDFGLFAIIYTITSPIGPLASSGSTWVLGGNFFKLHSAQKKGELLFNISIIDLVYKSFWVVFFLYISDSLLEIFKINNFENIFYLKILLISTWLTVFTPTISHLLVLMSKSKIFAFIENMRWILNLGVSIICLTFFKLGILSLFIGPVISSSIIFFIEISVLFSYGKFNFNKKWIIETFQVSMKSIPSNLMETIAHNSDRYFIQSYLNTAALGIYSHSQVYASFIKFISKGFERISSPLCLNVFSPQNTSESVYEDLNKIFNLFLLILLFISFFASLFSYDLINILTHGKFVEASQIMPLWFLLGMCNVFGIPFTLYLVSRKKTTFLMASTIITSFFTIILTFVLTNLYGLYGAVTGILVGNIILHLSRSIYARYIGCRLNIHNNAFLVLVIFLIYYFVAQYIELYILLKICLSVATLAISYCLINSRFINIEILKKLNYQSKNTIN